MSFSSLLGNQKIQMGLRRALVDGRLAHALLFGGPAGVGKRKFALTVAKALNCARNDGDACDLCPSCRRIEKGEQAVLALSFYA